MLKKRIKKTGGLANQSSYTKDREKEKQKEGKSISTIKPLGMPKQAEYPDTDKMWEKIEGRSDISYGASLEKTQEKSRLEAIELQERRFKLGILIKGMKSLVRNIEKKGETFQAGLKPGERMSLEILKSNIVAYSKMEDATLSSQPPEQFRKLENETFELMEEFSSDDLVGEFKEKYIQELTERKKRLSLQDQGYLKSRDMQIPENAPKPRKPSGRGNE